MKVIKPASLSVLTRCFEHQRSARMGVCVLAFVPLGPGAETTLLSEVSLWKLMAEALAGEGTLDATIPKVRAEFLVHGSAYAPGGRAVPQFAVRAEVGKLRKDLSVSGDRVWVGRRASKPQPLSQLRLNWAAAFGGPSYAKNPLGKGAEEIEVDPEGHPGVKARPLPNVEDPRALVRAKDAQPEPASMTPIDVSWPQRASLAGTYDRRWLENHYPGFARDVDWGLHNVAPRDQQRDEPWRPGESYRFTNLHPRDAVVEGRLPELRARAFVARSHGAADPRVAYAKRAKLARRAGQAPLEEVELRLQTLWFFPDEERLVLGWTGSVEIVEEDGADIVQLVLGAEHAGRTKPREHYERIVAKRLDPEGGAVASLIDADLLPEDLPPLPAELRDADNDLGELEGFARENAAQRQRELVAAARAHLRSRGIEPSEVGLDGEGEREAMELPALEELPKFLADKRAELERSKQEVQVEREAKREQGMAKLAALEGQGELSAARFAADVERTGEGPPKFSADGEKARLEQLAAQVRATGEVDGEIEALLDDPEHYERWKRAEIALLDGYRRTAHRQDPAPKASSRATKAARTQLRQAIDAGHSLSRFDLTGVDLSGADLRGANLAGALLESADLSGADLRGARLDGAVLAHANLEWVRLDEASLRGANLGGARIVNGSLNGADLSEAILESATLSVVTLAGANLTGASVHRATLSECDARSCVAPELKAIEVRLDRVDLSGADLTKAIFLELDLRTCKLSGAKLGDATFTACDLRSVDVQEAHLLGARFIEACRLDGAVLVRADLRRANLRGTSLANVDLTQARLEGADLTESDLGGANLYRAVAIRAHFDVANLERATLVAANLMGATFERATTRGADLRGANLHGADMARVRTDAGVQTDGALLTKVRIHPRAPGGRA